MKITFDVEDIRDYLSSLDEEYEFFDDFMGLVNFCLPRVEPEVAVEIKQAMYDLDAPRREHIAVWMEEVRMRKEAAQKEWDAKRKAEQKEWEAKRDAFRALHPEAPTQVAFNKPVATSTPTMDYFAQETLKAAVKTEITK